MIAAGRERAPDAALRESHRLGMAEMGFVGLSEQWLMRRAGDLHWRLIARAMGQEQAVFTCAEGRPLYAAFCATALVLDRPDLPRLGGRLDLAARLRRVGRNRLGSLIEIAADGTPIGRIGLISVFVGRGEAGNRGLVRRAPRVLAVPDAGAPALDRLARRATLAAAHARIKVADGPAFRTTPCPAVDFNAAGLLYFPSFAALADRAETAAGMPPATLLRSREVCFLGNVDPGEALDVRLLSRPRHRLALVTAADGRPLAVQRIVKAPDQPPV